MNNIPTAEEFFEQGGAYPELAIAFAKLHVEAAIEAISKIDFDDIADDPNANDYEETREMAVLNAYPLTNIK